MCILTRFGNINLGACVDKTLRKRQSTAHKCDLWNNLNPKTCLKRISLNHYFITQVGYCF